MKIIKEIIKKMSSGKILAIIFISFFLLVITFWLNFFAAERETQAADPWTDARFVNGNCYLPFTYYFNTGVRINETTGWNPPAVAGMPAGTGVSIISWLKSGWGTPYAVGGDDPLVHGVTGEIRGLSMTMCCDEWGTNCVLCCPGAGATFSGFVTFQGERNSYDEPNLATWADDCIVAATGRTCKGFPYGANIGVSTNEPPDLTIPTQPILKWSTWGNAQVGWRVQVLGAWDSNYRWDSSTSVQVPAGFLAPNSSYNWRVAVCGDISGQSCAWTPWANGDSAFSTNMPPPQPSNPSGSCLSPGTSATVSWSASAGATTYALRADDTTANGWNGLCDGSQNPGDVCLNVSGTSYSFSATPGHTYNWWVHACNSSGCSAQLNGVSFTCALFQIP